MVGARRAAQIFASLDEGKAVVLGRRRVPDTTAVIEQLVVAPSGVYVIALRDWEGRVERQDVRRQGEVFQRLKVAHRERTADIDRLAQLAAVVAAAVHAVPVAQAAPVTAMLCLVRGRWRPFARPLPVRGVRVIWPEAMVAELEADGPLSGADIEDVVAHLTAAFAPA